jgi:hypothetical protein
MKLIKLTLLAATAAVAATAFIGASSASAHAWIAVCLKQELLECKNLAKHPLLGRLLVLQLGTGTFKSNFTIECTEGQGESNELESQKEGGAGETKEYKGELTKLTFGGCKGGCTAVEVRTPQPTSLTMAVTELEKGEAGLWRLVSKSAKVNFLNCTFGVECEFEGNVNVNVQMNATESFFEPENTAFNLIKGSKILCGGTGNWTVGKYTFKWRLDDLKGSEHLAWPSLIKNLTKAEGVEL